MMASKAFNLGRARTGSAFWFGFTTIFCHCGVKYIYGNIGLFVLLSTRPAGGILLASITGGRLLLWNFNTHEYTQPLARYD